MKRILKTIFLPLLATTYISGCSYGPMGRSMGGWDHMVGYGWYGGGIMWIILIAIVAAVIYFILRQNPNWMGPAAKDSPIDILKRRYAAGEISKEEFESLKKDIES